MKNFAGLITKRLTTYLGALAVAFSTANVHSVGVTLDNLLGDANDPNHVESILVGDKLFSDWELLGQEDPIWGPPTDLATITVEGVGTGTAGDAYGLKFTTNLSLNAPEEDFDFMDLWFGFSVTATDPNKHIVSVGGSAVVAASGDDAFATIIKDVFSAAPDPILDIEGDLGCAEWFADTVDQGSFCGAGPVNVGGLNKVWIWDNIALSVDNFFQEEGSGEATLTSFEQRFIQAGIPEGEVPAPATLALFGIGLAGLGWSRRKNA